MASDTSKLIQLGVISGAHGIRGQVKIKSYTTEADNLTAYGSLHDASGKITYDITITGSTKNQLIASIKGIRDRNAAEALKGTGLFIPREALPDADSEEFYYEDLVGMEVITEAGEPFGTVTSINNHGAGDIVEIRQPDGSSEAHAFTRQTFPVIDLTARRLTIAPAEVIYASTDKEGEAGHRQEDA